MYTGNPGYIWDERLSKCQHRASAEDTVPRVSMPSLWRTKLLMAQKDRVNEGLQVSENWSSGVHDMEPWGVGWFFFGARTCSNILCSWQTEAHFFKTTQKWNARRCFFVFQCHNWHQQVFFWVDLERLPESPCVSTSLLSYWPPQVLDYALASSFQKLREGERQMIEEISESLGHQNLLWVWDFPTKFWWIDFPTRWCWTRLISVG